MKKAHPLLLSILSGLLLFAAWPESPFTFLIFIGFVPLLWMEAQGIKRKLFFLWIFFAMLIWNVSTTWWIVNSTVPGGIAAFIANSLLMCIPWMAFYNIKRRGGNQIGYIALIVFWLTFEYLHHNWELSWTWLTLGNVFSVQPRWIQWYEYTGASGGTLWILLVNVLIFLLLQEAFKQKIFNVRITSLLLCIILFPILFSLYFFQPVFKPRTPNNVIVVQPNIDPYTKFNANEELTQLTKLIRLSESKIDSNTRLVVWPETAIPLAIEEDQIQQHPFLQPVREFLQRHPHTVLLTGIEGFRTFDEQHKTKYSQKPPNSSMYYEAYNSAALFDTLNVQLYHKSKLVPGVEALPSFLTFLSKWFEQFGGTTGGYVKQDERTVLITANNSYKIAPAICYESIYGEFMSKFVRNGANIIIIITNDGWWDDTPGYQQHKDYARLRAIETRCWIARSANTGISCFIDPYGNIYQPQPWNIEVAINQAIPVSSGVKTFYVKNGDIISRIALGLTTILVFWNIFVIVKQRLRRAKKHSFSKQTN